MSKTLSEFAPVLHCSGLWSAQKGNLRATAIRLRDGSLCIYSPVPGIGDEARYNLVALGSVSILLAPNHYHNKGLTEHAEAYPDAALICSERARPRLEKQTSLSFEDLSTLTPLLPDGCALTEPDGLKTGEVWLTLDASKDHIWIVCDAFKGADEKAGSISRKVEMLGTFPTYGIKDKDTYSGWVGAKLSTQAPTIVVPCHGSIVQSEDLVSDIEALLR